MKKSIILEDKEFTPTSELLKVKDLLTDLKEVNELDYFGENRNIVFIGLKRMIYGIWHNGMNELGDNMIFDMNMKAKILYLSLIEKYKNKKECVKVSFID